MSREWQEIGKSKDAASVSDGDTGLGTEGIQAMQGVKSDVFSSEKGVDDRKVATPSSPNESDQILLEELSKPPYDESQLEYRIRSPHADYEAYKGIKAAERQHELGQQAATGDSLPDAIDTTLAARRESHSSDETPEDQYFREKYGTAPYTTAAYEQDEDE